MAPLLRGHCSSTMGSYVLYLDTILCASRRGSPSYGAWHVLSLLSPFFLPFLPSHPIPSLFSDFPHPTPNHILFLFLFLLLSLYLFYFNSPPEAAPPAYPLAHSHAPIPGAYLYPTRTPAWSFAQRRPFVRQPDDGRRKGSRTRTPCATRRARRRMPCTPGSARKKRLPDSKAMPSTRTPRGGGHARASRATSAARGSPAGQAASGSARLTRQAG